jgi:hypothetical protein
MYSLLYTAFLRERGFSFEHSDTLLLGLLQMGDHMLFALPFRWIYALINMFEGLYQLPSILQDKT